MAHELFILAFSLLSSCGAQAYLPLGMWDLSSPSGDGTHVPYTGRNILNHWATKEIPQMNVNCFCSSLLIQMEKKHVWEINGQIPSTYNDVNFL